MALVLRCRPQFEIKEIQLEGFLEHELRNLSDASRIQGQLSYSGGWIVHSVASLEGPPRDRTMLKLSVEENCKNIRQASMLLVLVAPSSLFR